MSMNNSLSRRQFLKMAAGAGAGLVLGIYLPGCQSEVGKPHWLTGDSADEQFSPSVFLKIAPDNRIIVVVPRTEMGQGVRTGMPMVLAEELDADWHTVVVESAIAGSEYGNQETGHSTSTSEYWTTLRQAGAVARKMLIAAAAQIWNVDETACVAENSEVIHPDGELRLTYGELAETAAQLEVPQGDTVTLKNPEAFKIIGRSLSRVDDPKFVDGSALFGFDVKVPDMVYAAIARSPVFGGKPGSFDAANAKTIDGVRDVVEIHRALAVVADNSWAAIRGRDALEIDWDEGDLADVSSAQIRENTLRRIEAETGFNGQDQSSDSLEAVYEIPFLAHAPMEPMNCVANAQSDYCEVWAPTQNPQLAKNVVLSPPNDGRVDRFLNQFFGWPEESVRVNVPLLGGGFGRRLRVDYVDEAVQVSKAVKQPVQVIWTRQDDMQHDFYHPMSFHYLSAELTPLAEFEHKAYKNSELIPQGAWRSVRQFSSAFFKESFIDELAFALNMDPYELRLQRYDDDRLKNVLQIAAEKADWGCPLPEGGGRGIAAFKTWGKTATAEVVDLSVLDDGKVKVNRVICVVDCGIAINPDKVKAQMEGGIAFALTAAIKSKVTIENGRCQQSNFHDYPILRMDEMPQIDVHIVDSTEPPTGVGEMSGPPLTPAVANAVFNATGKRIRHIPILPSDLI